VLTARVARRTAVVLQRAGAKLLSLDRPILAANPSR